MCIICFAQRYWLLAVLQAACYVHYLCFTQRYWLLAVLQAACYETPFGSMQTHVVRLEPLRCASHLKHVYLSDRSYLLVLGAAFYYLYCPVSQANFLDHWLLAVL
jgi:hypothetical protein